VAKGGSFCYLDKIGREKPSYRIRGRERRKTSNFSRNQLNRVLVLLLLYCFVFCLYQFLRKYFICICIFDWEFLLQWLYQ